MKGRTDWDERELSSRGYYLWHKHPNLDTIVPARLCAIENVIMQEMTRIPEFVGNNKLLFIHQFSGQQL